MIRFRERSKEEEQMDDPLLGRAEIETVLNDINRVNSWLGGNNITLKALNRLMKRFPREEYRIMDMGCGDGAMLREVSSYCAAIGINVKLIGIDLNRESIEIAEEKSSGFENISFLQGDILELQVDQHQYDILLCTLTLHHLSDEEIKKFLKKFSTLAGIGVIINDLDRNRLGYFLFKLFSSIFMKTRIAREDGLLSIKSGFTKRELQAFSKMLPQMRHRISWRWAFRYEWTLWHPQ